MNTEIITIGDELLIGQVIDTNSAWLAAEVNKIGAKILKKISISDDKNAILQSLKETSADLILVTGGLGPTKDDITKQTICEYFETKLVFSQSAYNKTEEYVLRRNGAMNDRNKQQAFLPENCLMITNNFGSASGMLFEKNAKTFIFMPGVPFEMKKMFSEQVIPIITEKFSFENIIQINICTFGIPESQLADKLADFEDTMPENMSLAYLPSPERNLLRLGIRGGDRVENRAETEKQIDKKVTDIISLLGQNIYSFSDEYLENTIGELLRGYSKKVAVAESCTGGNISRLITSISGSSEYFEGGVVAYSNRIKSEILGVQQNTLDQNGAVSKETVEEMALGIKNLYKSDYGIGVSGIAGPGGAVEGKPVGTVWIAVADDSGVISQRFQFGELREIIVRRASATALDMLRRLIINS